MFYRDGMGKDAAYLYGQVPPKGFLTKLPAGAYEFHQGGMMSPTRFQPVRLTDEHVVEMDTKPFQRVMGMTRKFFDPSIHAKANRYGVTHRMGILMYGPQGTGKSVLVRQVVRELAEANDAVAIAAHPQTVRMAVELAREGAPRRPIIVIWEEFEEHQGWSPTIKDLMDGFDSPENVLYLATTNYLERIEDALVRRPGRFSQVLEVGYFDRDDRARFVDTLLSMWQVTPEDRGTLDLEGVLEATEDKSADDIKSILLNALIYGLPPEETVADMAEIERNKRRAKAKRRRDEEDDEDEEE